MLNADKFEYQNYNTLKMLISKYYYISPPNLIRCQGLSQNACVCARARVCEHYALGFMNVILCPCMMHHAWA